jgi:hypothetical protein
MNFALAFGWATEGVVGSGYKIDPVFIGKKINRLGKLINLTSSQGARILITDSLYSNLSPGVKNYCRSYDELQLGQGEKIERVYILDFDTNYVTPSRNRGEKKDKRNKDLRTKKEENMSFLAITEMDNYDSNVFFHLT